MSFAACLFALVLPLPVTEAEDLAELRREWHRTTGELSKIALLDRIAGLYVDGDPAAVDVTSAVAAGLEDDAVVVRTHAATLLGAGLDDETAIEALVRASRAQHRLETSGLARLTKDLPAVPDYRTSGQEKFLKGLREREKAMRELGSSIEDFTACHDALARALSSRRDDRCVDGLDALLDSRARSESAIDGLLAFGTAPALGHVISAIEQYERMLAGREKARKKLVRQRPDKVPGHWRGTKDSWREREEKRIEGLALKYDELTATVREWEVTIRERLRVFAESHGLDPVPDEVLPVSKWKSWRAAAAPALPASLAD